MTAPNVNRTIAFARFPGLIRDAAREFKQQTGFTAVTTLGSASADTRTCSLPPPPIHPRCAERIRGLARKVPCDAEWQKHLRSAEKMQGSRVHACPLGLRCAGVPIAIGDELFGLAKFVSGQEVTRKKFRSLVGLLEVLIDRPCQELHVLVLQEEMHTLQGAVDRLREAKGPSSPAGNRVDLPAAGAQTHDHSPNGEALIGQVLDYLNEHYADRDLSLVQIASAVGRNEKYVAHLFVEKVGERMRTYITTLRVRRACEMLLTTSRPIDQIAGESGFVQAGQFRQSFRRAMGVTASEYRHIFATGA